MPYQCRWLWEWLLGVFLQFGLDLIGSLYRDIWIAGPMAVTWIILGLWPVIGRRLPPLIGALLVGGVCSVLFGGFDWAVVGTVEVITPVIHVPEWSLSAMFELVIPLAITVLMVQNGQGIAVLRDVGHAPPVNAIAAACGIRFHDSGGIWWC